MSDTVTATEFMHLYGARTFRFSSYYKFAFNYRLDDTVWVSVGGSSDDIYRASLNAEMTLIDLLWETSTEYAFAYIGDKDVSLDDDAVWQVVHDYRTQQGRG